MIAKNCRDVHNKKKEEKPEVFNIFFDLVRNKT